MKSNKTSIESRIKTIYRLSGNKKQKINPCELIITEKDNSLIELDIIISDHD